MLFYHLVQNHLFFCLLPKNLKTKIYKTILLSTALYGWEYEMDGAYGMHGIDEKYIQNFGQKT